jgi:hypothetical protein
MALLSRLSIRYAVAASVSLLAGCAIIEAWRDGAKPLGFTHRVHVTDQGLDCTDCHTLDGVEQPTLPAQAACDLCHADLDAEKAPERKIASLFENGAIRATGAGRLPAEVTFPHPRHVAAGLECATCHAGIDSNDRVEDLPRVTMAVCNDCHAERKVASGECSTCHTELSPEHAPPSHEGNWKKNHGACVRAKSGATAERCDLCHGQSSCTDCHLTTAPENHDGYWRVRGHGIVASMDRQSCATCHDSDSCDSCHTTTEPKSHSANWGAPLDRHCTTCHVPLRDESCQTCHKGTPSHRLATPKPPTHLSGMNCRMCHGHGQPLPHVDNGDDCNSCHH